MHEIEADLRQLQVSLFVLDILLALYTVARFLFTTILPSLPIDSFFDGVFHRNKKKI